MSASFLSVLPTGHNAASASPGSITVYGHGWGHGRGLSQYGAQGYATMFGWSSAQILDHYYGNTTSGWTPSGQQISVRLSANEGADISVWSGAGYTVGGYTSPPGNAVDVTFDGANYLIRGRLGGCGGPAYPWVAVPSVVISSSDPAPGNDRNKMLTLCGGNTYRGQLEYRADGGKRTVNHLSLEDYARGVVPRESPASFASAALEAQSVAARSYAYVYMRNAGSICDTTSCQVYRGAFAANGSALEHPRTDAAVAATTGLVRFRNGQPISTEYSSSSGGWTAGGTFPVVIDEGDAVPSNTRHNWTTTIPIATLESRYGIGTFIELRASQRNGVGEWGGRVQQVQIVGTAGTAIRTGEQFRSDTGLFSAYFSTSPSIETLAGPSAVSPEPGRIDLFTPGLDSSPWHLIETGSGIGAWQSLGGITNADMDAASWGPGRLDVFARGSDAALWHQVWTSDRGWWGWERLGGILASGPTAVSWEPNRADVFARGIDGGLWQLAWDGSRWSSWYPFGGGFTGDPDASSWAPGRLDIFVRGLDGQLWQLAFDGTRWSGWSPLGGALSSAPSAVSWGPNRLDVFARGFDGALWQRSFNGSQWVPWGRLGGQLSSAPDASSQWAAQIDVFARGMDGRIWQLPHYGGWNSSWFPVAGLPG